MNMKKILAPAAGLVLTILGVVLTCLTRPAALAEAATAGQSLYFALSLIVVIAGVVTLIVSLVPQRRHSDTKALTMAAMFAALCYIGFTFFKIDIPVGSEKTAFHLGNVFCVLAALFVGGLWGGMAGAVGMTIADLTTGYITSAPKTFLLKLGIGLITGLVAHRIFRLGQEGHSKRYTLGATVVSCIAGMAFNVVADPLVGYFYKMYVLGIPQEIANAWAKMGAVTTLVNAIVAVVAASVLYAALRPALKRSNLLPEL